MTSENNIFSFGDSSSDPRGKARAALRAVRQYQQDWQEHGVNRVHKYFDDVEGDWLENFDRITVGDSSRPVSGVSFSDVVTQLKSLGLSSFFIENIALPSWWRSKPEHDEGVTHRLLQALSQRLHLEINFHQDSSGLLLNFVPIPSKKYKLQKRQENPELFSYLANSIAVAVLGTVDLPSISIPGDPLTLRKAILQANPYVGLGALLEFCWNFGLPVVHFDISELFGKGNKGPNKSDGLVVMTGDRPVVVIGSSRSHSAWLLFILSHELGHIAHGHLQEGILSDESLKDGVKDEEEEAANQFAMQLLFGDASLQWPGNLNQRRLLSRVLRLSEEHQIDPGVLILNYGWQTGNWGCAVGALNQLEPDANAPAQINAYYQSHLVSIDEESQDYLERVNVLAAQVSG